MNEKTFCYGKDTLSTGLALELAHGERGGIIDAQTKEKILQSHQAVETIVANKNVVYGITTGFGPLCTTRISEEDTRLLQYNILKSHSVGVGEPMPDEVVKLMLILKMHALSQGYSGISMEILERINWHINQNVIPVVPRQGSVGASGDLAPLAHLFLPLIGLGKVRYKGKTTEMAEVFHKEGIEPVELGPKSGLALINGTQFIAAYAVKVVERFHNCLETADIIGAMMLEGLKGSVRPFEAKLHNLRPYTGNHHVAYRLRTMLQDSEIVTSHKDCDRVQDPYSLRCMPQVHGASRTAWLHLKELLHVELNSVTDNPVVFNENDTISGGNFHGQPMALPLDYAAFAVAELGNISDRRTYLSLEGSVDGLPKLLMKDTGINSGFMLPQYTSAALVTENKTLCFPASADSVPTSLGQEDHVSMGSISARKALTVVENLEKILAVELFCAAQAFDYRRPLKSGKIIEACHAAVRDRIEHVDMDRVFADDIEVARQMIANQELVKVANETALKENINLNGPYHELFGLY
jgi:histidine ammonia-lyase